MVNLFSASIALGTLLLSCTLVADDRYPWPNNTLAAVSLSYDDALNSQLDNAIPALDEFGFKGSFYLTLSSPVFSQRKTEWQAIAQQGHELGNHTINHACRGSLPNREWVKADNDLDKIPLNKLLAEITTANKILKQLDNQSERTFTLPCTDKLVSGIDYLQKIKPHFIGIKTRVAEIAPTMTGFDIKNVSVIAPVDMTGEQLINYVKLAGKNGTMVNFTFHGIGGDHLSISNKAHTSLLAYLADNRDIYWVDTFRNISLHINQLKD